MRTLRRLLALTEAPSSRLLAVVALGTATVAFGVGLMATAGYLISRAAEHPEILALSVAIVAVRFFGLARPLARYLERLTSHDLALRVLGRVRVRVYDRLEPLAPVQLDGYRRGDLLSRVVADVDALQDLYLRGLLPPLVGLAAGAVSVAVTAAFLPAAALVLAAGLLVATIVVPATAAVADRQSGKLVAQARGDLAADLVEAMSGAPELAVYGADGRIAALEARDRTHVRLWRRAAFAGGAGDAVRVALTGVTVTGVLAVSVSAHAGGHLSRVLIAMLALLALAAFEAVQPLAQSATDLRRTIAAGRRVLEVIDRSPVVVDPSTAAPRPESPFPVALENVRVRYTPGAPPVLDGVSLRLEPGSKVALVGPSGAGKTTVVNLLLRFLDPEAGRVTLNGRDLREYRQEDVRRAIAVAGQDSHLFSTTIRENVRLARPEARDDEIEDALRQARIWDWVDGLPDGWNTLVGEQGRELSGGQRQRIVLARALLAGATVLVLDEPTAHLDQPTAERLVEDILDASDGRTVLLITHRPEGLDRVDEIISLAG